MENDKAPAYLDQSIDDLAANGTADQLKAAIMFLSGAYAAQGGFSKLNDNVLTIGLEEG